MGSACLHLNVAMKTFALLLTVALVNSHRVETSTKSQNSGEMLSPHFPDDSTCTSHEDMGPHMITVTEGHRVELTVNQLWMDGEGTKCFQIFNDFECRKLIDEFCTEDDKNSHNCRKKMEPVESCDNTMYFIFSHTVTSFNYNVTWRQI